MTLQLLQPLFTELLPYGFNLSIEPISLLQIIPNLFLYSLNIIHNVIRPLLGELTLDSQLLFKFFSVCYNL